MTMLEVLPHYTGNIIAAILLLMVIFVMFISNVRFTFRSKIFMSVTILVIGMFILDILMGWLILDRLSTSKTIITVLFNLILVKISVSINLFATYIDYLIHHSRERIKSRFYYMHGTIILLILLIWNFSSNQLFSFNEMGKLVLESWFIVLIGLHFLVILYTMFMIYLNRSKTHQNLLLGSLMCLVIPTVSTIIQTYVYEEMLLTFPSIAVSVTLAYFLFESTNGSREYMTNLLTRERITQHINDMIAKNDTFSLLVIDIDNFKQINDKFGHSEGDNAIIFMAKALNETFNKNCMCARWGGDEFLVVLRSTTKAHINMYKQALNQYLQDNHTFIFEPLTFSLGIYIREETDDKDINQLFKAADMSMYQFKQKNQVLRRRRSDR